MDRIRDISNATVITHGENPEVFTIERGIFIPIDMAMDTLEPEIRSGLMKHLEGLYTPEGYIKFPRTYPRPNKNPELQGEMPSGQHPGEENANQQEK